MAILPQLNLNQPRGLRGGLLPTSQPLQMDRNFLDNEKEIYNRGVELDKMGIEQQQFQQEQDRLAKNKELEENRRLAEEELRTKQLIREKELADAEKERKAQLDRIKEQREFLEKKREDDQTRISGRNKRIDTAMDDRLSYMEKARELERPEFVIKSYNQRYKELIENGDLSPLTLEEAQYKEKPIATINPQDPKYKASTDLIKDNIEENRKLSSTLNGLRGTLDQIKKMPDDDFNKLAVWKSTMGNLMSYLGMDNTIVREAQSLEQLQKSLEKQNLGVLKTFLTGAISNAEGERVASALGTITDRKASLVASYKLMVAENEFKYETRLIENAVLDKNGGKDMARSSSIVAKVQDFPKIAVKKNLATGAHDITTFYEFSKAVKRDKPNSTYTEIREKWEKEYFRITGNQVKFPKLDEETANSVNGVFQ